MELVFCVKEDARAVLVLYKYCSHFCGFVEICFNLVCMWRLCAAYKKYEKSRKGTCFQNFWKRSALF